MNFINLFLYRISEWIMRFAFVNVLWIGFTCLGFIILGFFPSTMAMFSVVRKWIMGESDIPVFKTFWNTFKSEWTKSNILGGLLAGMTILILIDLFVIKQHTSELLLQWSKYPLFLLVVIFAMLLFYVFPTYVHYDIPLLQVLKNSFLIMLLNPFYNLVMIVSLVLLFFVGRLSPPLIIIFGGSGSAFIIMWSCYQSFLNIQRKKEAINTSKP